MKWYIFLIATPVTHCRYEWSRMNSDIQSCQKPPETSVLLWIFSVGGVNKCGPVNSHRCVWCVLLEEQYTHLTGKHQKKKTIKMLPTKIYSEVYVSLLLLREIKGRLWKPSVLVNRKEEITTITQPFRWDWWLMFENGNVKHARKHCWIIHNVSQMSKSSVFW